MPITLGPNGELIEVDAVPDRVAQPAAQGTIQASLENQLEGREPLVQLVDEGGTVYDVGESGVDAALSSGRFRLATGREVAQYDALEKRKGGVETLKTLGESLAAGVADIPLAAGRLVGAAAGADMSDVTGRQFLANLFALGGDLDYDERALERAQANEGAAFAGNLASSVAGGFGLAKGLGLVERAAAAGLGSRALGTAVAGAVEGGVMGASQASEEAFLGDTELTAEQTLAGMGLGALLGGGVGLGLGAGRAFFGRRGTRGMTPVDSPKLGPTARGDDALEGVASRALGPDVKPAPGLGQHLREGIESAQSAVAGVDRGALGEVGATRGFLDPASAAYKKRGLWWNRDKIWAESTERLTRELEQAADDASDVFDTVVDSGLKREAMASKLKGGDYRRMVDAGRAELTKMREEIAAAIARTDDFGNRKLLEKKLAYLDAIDPDKAGATGAAGAQAAAVANVDDAAADFLRKHQGFESLRDFLGGGHVRSSEYANVGYDALRKNRGAKVADATKKMVDDIDQALADAHKAGLSSPGTVFSGRKWTPEKLEEFLRDPTNSGIWSTSRSLKEAQDFATDNVYGKRQPVLLEIKQQTGVPVSRLQPAGTLADEDEITLASRRKFRVIANETIDTSDGPLRKITVEEVVPPPPATIDDAADWNIAVDKAKRALQKDVKALRDSAGRSGEALGQMQNRQLADYLESIQERARLGLEDSATWGKAGDAQKAINSKWGEFLRTQQLYREGFLRRVEGSDYFTGRPVFRVDPEKVGRYIRATGRKEGALLDEYFRRHIDAREALAREIGEQFSTKGDELQRVSESTANVRKLLGGLDETARAVNQVDSIIEAERTGLAGAFGGGAILGGVVGGLPGALLGAGMQAVSRPGAMIRSAAAIEQLARNVNHKIDLGIRDFFRRTAQPIGGKAQKALKGARAAGRALPIATSMALFRGKETDNQKAYQKRANEVLAATHDFGSGIRDRAATALADLPSTAPKLSANLATTATKGAEFLKSKLPAPVHNTKSLTPKSTPVTVSDLEIQQFARYWSAVTNPLSVIDDLRRGDCTKEQVEALQAVYPKLYNQIRDTVRTQLMELDEQRVLIPYQARLQLDLLLDLNGAGEATATVEFMTRFQEIAAQQPQGGNQPQPQPPAKPINFASRLRSGADALTTTNGEP